MQITRETGWKDQGAAVAQVLEQREEFSAVRSLTSKLSAERMSADLYPELDMALPFHWESLTGKEHKLSKSSDSQEFEFNMSGVSANSSDHANEDVISPADDLFFKGQLLPLHLPKRLQMVQKLSSPVHSDEGNSASVTVSCFFQPSGLKYSSLGSDEGYLGSALVNSRSSSFHSQGSTNFWESDSPGELESGDSSSSRDSSGSCQDACPSLSDKLTLPKFDKDQTIFDREGAFYRQAEDCKLTSEKSFSSWLRTPFKWKVFFGLKKPSKVESLDKYNNKGSFGSAKGLNISRTPRPGTYFSGEQKLSRMPSLDELEHRGRLFSSPSSGTGIAHVERESDGLPPAKDRGSLHMKPGGVKASNARIADHEQAAGDKLSRIVDMKAKASFPGNLFTSSSPMQEQILPVVAACPFSKPLSQRSVVALASPHCSGTRCKSPAKPTFSGNLRIPSFSRSSKVSAKANNAASPHHSGLLNHSSSTMAELHSAIQGAIAHCKQSELEVI